MAKIEKTTIQEEVRTVVTKPAFVLTLSEEEAKTLLLITRLIAGDRHSSRRKHTDEMGAKLECAGVLALRVDSRVKSGALSGIYFYNEEGLK